MKIYIVGHHGPEHNSVMSVHKTHAGAMKAWNMLRIELLDNAKSHTRNADGSIQEMYQGMIDKLSCEDPDKIDNYPHDTPYIHEYEVEE